MDSNRGQAYPGYPPLEHGAASVFQTPAYGSQVPTNEHANAPPVDTGQPPPLQQMYTAPQPVFNNQQLYGVQPQHYPQQQPIHVYQQPAYGQPLVYGVQQPIHNTVAQQPVTTQMQVPRWANMRFLEAMKSVKLIEKKGCPAVCFCFPTRKLHIHDDSHNYLGYSVSPCTCCSEEVSLNIPEGNVVMQPCPRKHSLKSTFIRNRTRLLVSWMFDLQTKKSFDCLQWCCWIFFICEDVIVMEIRDHVGNRIGSFDYSPKFCRHECCCCTGQYFVKDRGGRRIFYVNKECCACRKVVGMNIWPFGTVPLLMCANDKIVFPICQQWNIPVKISDSETDQPIARVKMLNRPWWKQFFLCAPIEYYIEYHRTDESTENKALLLGTTLAMDHYHMNADLFNDDNIESPYYMH